MKALLMASAALLVGLPVQADTVWLFVRESYGEAVTFEKIPITSMDQCEEQGALYLASSRLSKNRYRFGFECFEGK